MNFTRSLISSLGVSLGLAAALANSAAAADARFGFVGTGGKAFAQKFGVPYYALEGNYHVSTGSLFSSVNPDNDPLPGYKVLRKVAKLSVRTDALGQSNAQSQAAFEAFAQSLTAWYNVSGARPAKPVYTWYTPDAAALAAAESLQIVETIRREKQRSPAITGTVWEIGNEPNFFPALLPAQYAAIYANYHRIIKREDSTAKIAFGPLFIREAGEDLRPMTRELLVTKLTSGGALALLGQSRFDSLVADLAEGTLFTRVFNLGTAAYVSQAFAALPVNVRPDYISLHVYPYDDRAPTLTKVILQSRIDSMITALSGITGGKPVWITEFGNVNAALSASAVSTAMSDLIDVLTANAGIGNLFYYKATGADQQLDMLSGLGANSGPPLTRLANDSAFSPADGNFSCSQLNIIGQMYYLRAVGASCADVAPTVAPTLVSPETFSTGIAISPAIAWGAVNGAIWYHLQVSTSTGFGTTAFNDSALTGSPRTVGPLSPGTAYYWRMRGRNQYGSGPWSQLGLFTTAASLPGVPTLVAPAAFAMGVSPEPTLNWNAVAGATGYKVQLSTDPAFNTALILNDNVSETSVVSGVLAGNTAYYWRVNAKNDVGTGEWSSIRSFTTGALPLPGVTTLVSPANFHSTSSGVGSIFMWNKVTYAAQYHLQIGNSTTFNSLYYQDSTIGDTILMTGPQMVGQNYWRVRAKNPTGVGPWSDIRGFTVSSSAILPGRLGVFGARLENGALRIHLTRSERVRASIYGLDGSLLYSLDARMEAGAQSIALPASLSGGLRILDLRIGAARDVLKLAP